MARSNCLRTRWRLRDGNCSRCGQPMAPVAHLSMIGGSNLTCADCCANCRADDALDQPEQGGQIFPEGIQPGPRVS